MSNPRQIAESLTLAWLLQSPSPEPPEFLQAGVFERVICSMELGLRHPKTSYGFLTRAHASQESIPTSASTFSRLATSYLVFHLAP